MEELEEKKGKLKDPSLLDKYKRRFKAVMMYQASMDSVVLEASSLARVMQFYGMAAEWIVGTLCRNCAK